MKKIPLYLLLLSALYLPAQATFPMDMVSVTGGTFDMGCTAEQEAELIALGSSCGTAELPIHEVTLADYSLGRYEVSQGQFSSLMPEYDQSLWTSNFGLGASYPAYYVSWYDAITFCNRLSVQDGYTPVYYFDAGFTAVFDSLAGSTNSPYPTVDVYTHGSANGYRLPTEAEWEYAARGGILSTQTAYSGGAVLDDVGWYSGNNGANGTSTYGSKEIGGKLANELGIHDMSGNLWEWCSDWYDSDYYAMSPDCNPEGSDTGSNRVARGGDWVFNAQSCRVANRLYLNPGNRFILIGFRVARRP